MRNIRPNRFLFMAIAAVLLSLLAVSNANALMPTDKVKEAEKLTFGQDSGGGIDTQEQSAYTKNGLAPTGEEADKAISNEDNAAIEKNINEAIKKTGEEKRRIIEEVNKEKEAYPSLPDPMKPYIVEKSIALPQIPKPESAKIQLLEKHNVLLGERPFLLACIILALAVILYYLYIFVLRRK